jgi:hypothetical protein
MEYGNSCYNGPVIAGLTTLAGSSTLARMKRKIALPALRAKAPEGFRFPRLFDRFVKAAAATDPAKTAWFEVVWTDARKFELLPEAARALVPFLRLGDGGFVAFWTAAPRGLPVVHFDSEGERHVVAASFDDFLARLVRQRSGVPDLDDGEDVSVLAAMAGKSRPVALAGLAKAFARWCSQGSALQQPTKSSDGERVRRELGAIARRMVRDGLQRVATIRSWWSIDFKVERARDEIRATYLDYGEWKPVPARYGIEPVLARMLTLVKHPKLRRYEVSVLKQGLVTVNNDRELVLEAKG